MPRAKRKPNPDVSPSSRSLAEISAEMRMRSAHADAVRHVDDYNPFDFGPGHRSRPALPTSTAPEPEGASTVARSLYDLSDAALRRSIEDLSGARDITPDQDRHLSDCLRELERRSGTGSRSIDTRTASRTELRDRAMRVVERDGRHLSSHQLDHVDALLRSRSTETDGTLIAKRLLITESDAYRSAFRKGISETHPVFTPEENSALLEFRAMSEGTPSAGGYGVPVLIDPTIILTQGAAEAPILNVCRLVTVTTNAWHGVSSAGVTWNYDAESSAVEDDTPTLAQPTISVYSARGFVPYSIELGQDYPDFAEEMSTVMNAGYLTLVATATATGSGSTQPFGIFTRMAATTAGSGAAHITVSTVGSFGAVDVRAAWSKLPERFRPKANWVMSPSTMAQVRSFGNGLALSDFTVNLLADGTSVLTGREVLTTDYAPAFTGTTGVANIAIVGDFSQYVFVQRAGMTVELVNALFDTSTGRPTGQRGLFAYARHGADVTATNAFRLIANT